jgi:hypothetical protein
MAHFMSKNASEGVECILNCVHIPAEPPISISLSVLLYASVRMWGVCTKKGEGVQPKVAGGHMNSCLKCCQLKMNPELKSIGGQYIKAK